MGIPEHITKELYLKHCVRRFGDTNPTRIDNPVWDYLIRTELDPFHARTELGLDSNWGNIDSPDFCFKRFGITITEIDDGRVIYIAGEHEDYYDPDFCIYNDVIVTKGFESGRDDSDGYTEYYEVKHQNVSATIEYYGYPKQDFPPTDFHTATLVGKWIYITGSLGYMDERHVGQTQLLRLCTDSYQIERVSQSGDAPGWIHNHTAELLEDRETIRIRGGEVVCDAEAPFEKSLGVFDFNTRTQQWSPVQG